MTEIKSTSYSPDFTGGVSGVLNATPLEIKVRRQVTDSPSTADTEGS